MMQYVDYSKLSRRELQGLCKEHKIPANKTNVFMADALDALLNNAPRQQEEFQEEEIPAPDSPDVEKVVERVKGKRATQKALLAEAEVDSLAGLLADSSLNPQERATHYAGEPQITSEEPVMGENILPLAPLVVATKGRRGRPRLTKKEEKVVEEPAAKSLRESNKDSTGINGLEVGEESIMDESEGWAKSTTEAVPEALTSPLEAVSNCDDVQLGELSMVYVRTKNQARTHDKVSSEQVEAIEPAAMEDVESDLTVANSGVDDEEEMVPEPTEEEMETTSFPPESEEMVSQPIVEEAETDFSPPAKAKKSGKAKRGAAKSLRIRETKADATVKVPEEMVEAISSERESTSATAELVPDVEEVSLPELTVETEKASPTPVEKKKTRKPKKAGSKSRRNVEVVTHDQVLLDAATVYTGGPTERPNDAVAEKPFAWTVPTPVLEEELPLIVLKEKPKARKSKKASTKARGNAEQPAAVVNGEFEEYQGEPEAVESGKSFVASSLAETAVNECNIEAVNESVEEPVTPVKKAVGNNLGDEKENEKDPLNMSLRKLKVTLKEKTKGLQSRGKTLKL